MQHGSCLKLWTPKAVRQHLAVLQHGTSTRPKYRNQSRREQALAEAEARRLSPFGDAPPSAAGGGAATARLALPLLSKASTPREAWVEWLRPHFTASDGTSCAYFTGTYSDDYGFQNGLTLARNVHKDFRRYLDSAQLPDAHFINGVERHRFRDVLHLHGIIKGDFTAEHLEWLKAWWSAERGFARVLPVQDGCASYVTKYALKGDTDSFDWRLS